MSDCTFVLAILTTANVIFLVLHRLSLREMNHYRDAYHKLLNAQLHRSMSNDPRVEDETHG